MKRLTVCAAALMAAAFGATVLAQKTTELGKGGGGSPHVADGVGDRRGQHRHHYGRPALKGRAPGKDIDPFEGKEWRTGADEQTTFITSKPLKFGTLSVPAGRYGHHTIPVNGTWQLIVRKRDEGLGNPVSWRRGSRACADDDGQGAEPGENLTILDRRHARRRDASHRLGHHARERAVHRWVSVLTKATARHRGLTPRRHEAAVTDEVAAPSTPPRSAATSDRMSIRRFVRLLLVLVCASTPRVRTCRAQGRRSSSSRSTARRRRLPPESITA